MLSSCPSSCSVSCISPCQQHCFQVHYPPNSSTQSPAISPWQRATHCDDMCPSHYCPTSSQQSSFSAKFLTPIGNIQPNFLLPQGYATPTPYDPVFARCNVHKVSPRTVAYSKFRNKHNRLEGLLQFKKLIISCKLYIMSYSLLLSSQEERCLYISTKKSINNQTAEYNENDKNTTVKDLQRRATFRRCVTKRL